MFFVTWQYIVFKKEYITFSEKYYFCHILYDNNFFKLLCYLIHCLFQLLNYWLQLHCWSRLLFQKRPKRNIFLEKFISLLLFSEMKAVQCFTAHYCLKRKQTAKCTNCKSSFLNDLHHLVVNFFKCNTFCTLYTYLFDTG